LNRPTPHLATCIAALLLASAAVSAQAQQKPATTRGFGTPSAIAAGPQGHRYVVVIGIDKYANWPTLSTAVEDADAFAQLMQSQFGYTQVVAPLTEQRATQKNIISFLDDDLRTKLKPEDDLIVFFAGHGTTRTDIVDGNKSEVGFIVPFDARASSDNEHWSDYISTEEFLRVVNSLPAKHILVILDSCHSGLALGKGFTRSRGGNERFAQEMSAKVSRKVISSAQGDELAADQGPVPGHSLFTGLLLQSLKNGQADAYHDGFVTSAGLGIYMQHAVRTAPNSHQTPVFGSFLSDNNGDLVLRAGGVGPAAVSTEPDTPTGPSRGAPAKDAYSAPAQPVVSMDNTPPLAANSAGLGELETKIDGLKARADAANASLDSLRLSIQRSTGGNLRSDMAVAQSSMKTNLAKAQQALAQKDADRAAQFAKLCEQNLATIEDFLH
jgi:hypothetical protein